MGGADVVGHVGQKARFGVVGAGLVGKGLLQFLPHAQVAVHIPHAHFLGMGQKLGVVLFFFLQRRQHPVPVAPGFGIGVVFFLRLYANGYFLRIADQVVVHGRQDALDLRVVPGVHLAGKQVVGRIAELGRMHGGQLLPDFSPAFFVALGIAQLVVQQHFHQQNVIRQQGPAVVLLYTAGQRSLRLVQAVQMAADLGQIAVDVGVYFPIRIGQMTFGLADGLQCLFIFVLGQVGHSEVIVLVGIAADLVIFPRNLQTFMDIKAGQGIGALTVNGHAHQVKTGDDLRAIGIALVVDDEWLQNLPRGAEVPLPVMQQRRMEIGHHPYIGFVGLLFQDLRIERLALCLWCAFQCGFLLGEFFVTHHNACTIPGKSVDFIITQIAQQ